MYFCPPNRPLLDVRDNLVRPRVAGGSFAAPTYRPSSPPPGPVIANIGTVGGVDSSSSTAPLLHYEAVMPSAPTACFARAPRWAEDEGGGQQRGQQQPRRTSSPTRDGDGQRFPVPEVREPKSDCRHIRMLEDASLAPVLIHDSPAALVSLHRAALSGGTFRAPSTWLVPTIWCYLECERREGTHSDDHSCYPTSAYSMISSFRMMGKLWGNYDLL